MKGCDIHDGTASVAVARKNVCHRLNVDAVNVAFCTSTNDLLVPVEGAAEQFLACENNNDDVKTSLT